MSETIVRRVRNVNYATIPNHVAEDTRLSLDARGLLVYLLVKPSDWNVHITDIQRRCNIGRDKAYKLIESLVHAGYLERRTIRRDGRFYRHEIIVYDEPMATELLLPSPQPEKQETGSPLPELPEMVSPLPDLPDPAKPDAVNQDAYKEPILTKDSPPTPPLAAEGVSFEDEFDQFWKSWPVEFKDTGRKDWFRAKWSRALESHPGIECGKMIKAASDWRDDMRKRKKQISMRGFFRNNVYLEFVNRPPPPIQIQPYSDAWMALRLRRLSTSVPRVWRPTAAVQKMIDDGKIEMFRDQQRASEYPAIILFDEMARDGKVQTVPAKEYLSDYSSYVTITVGSPEWLAWQKWHHDKGWPWVQDMPKRIKYLFLPSQFPKEIKAHEEATAN